MRNFTLLLIALMLLCCSAFAEEDDWTLEGALSEIDPSFAADIFIDVGEAVDVDAPAVESIYEADGSILITITAAGDFTVGGDSRKSSNIWDTELKKHGGDYQFAL